MLLSSAGKLSKYTIESINSFKLYYKSLRNKPIKYFINDKNILRLLSVSKLKILSMIILKYFAFLL